jgi:hypothetical protein
LFSFLQVFFVLKTNNQSGTYSLFFKNNRLFSSPNRRLFFCYRNFNSTKIANVERGFSHKYTMSLRIVIFLIASYLIGICLLLEGEGFDVTPDQKMVYDAIMSTVDIRKVNDARKNATAAYAAYYAQTRFLTRCGNTECTRLFAVSKTADLSASILEMEYAATLSKARRGVGVFSNYAVNAMYEDTWTYLGGKQDGETSSYVFINTGNSDSIAIMLVMLIALMCLLYAVIVFIWVFGHAASLAISFQAGFFKGIVFVYLAACVAFAWIVSYLILACALCLSVYICARLIWLCCQRTIL